MSDKRIFIYSDELNHNGYPEECPFNTSRASRTMQTVDSMGLLSGDDREVVAPRRAERVDLEAFHTVEYLDILEAASRGEMDPYAAMMMGLGTPDCPVWLDMYPYLALAVMMAACLDGVENNIKAGPPVNKNIFAMSQREKKRLKIGELPADLSQALDQMEKSQVIKDALGEHIFTNFITAKRQEWHEYIAHVHQWERDRYLDQY